MKNVLITLVFSLVATLKPPVGLLYSTLLFALTVQLWEDAFGNLSCPDHIRPGEATGGGKHGGVVHKLLMETPTLITELRP